MGICMGIYRNQQLKQLDVTIPLFVLKESYTAKVVSVYDGDTCHVVIRFNNQWTRFKVRCNGYDSPEMAPPKNTRNRDKIIESAMIARAYFAQQTTNCHIDLRAKYTKKELKDILVTNTKLVKLEFCHMM
jgi:endonuclease YncB( thermonuclease family)